MKAESAELTIGQALDLGCEFAMAGNAKSAESLFRGVLIHEPENFEAIERLGTALFEQGRTHEALYWFWRGKKLDRRHPMALTNYGLCVSHLGHFDEGVEDLQRAVYQAERQEVSPAVLSLVYNNLGNTLERLNRHAEALAWFDKGIAQEPRHPLAHYNRGIALLRLNRQREAIPAFDTALTIKPNDPDALYNRSMAHLLLGNLKQGFEDYDARLLTSENEKPLLGLPADMQWKGESLAGKRILVHAEQGLGDTIHFLRFLPMLKERFAPAEIAFICHKPVRHLLGGGLPVTLLEPGQEMSGLYDCWVALMSLPRWLGVAREADFPPPFVPKVDPVRVAHQIVVRGRGLNVGVCWAGQWQHKNDRHRSIPLATFAGLFDAPGCHFVSMQQMREGEREEFDRIQEHNWHLEALNLEDFRDTAAVIANLDIVVSADTSVAHLAASMGKPTFILIPAFGTDWRWLLQRTDSPWYPSATLYRQSKIGDWANVIERLREDLSAMAAQRCAA